MELGGGRDFKIPTKIFAHTRHQVRGIEICEKLGSKAYPVFISLYKRYPQVCETAYSWVSDYPNAKNKERLFLWKIKQLRLPSQNK